MTTVNSKMLNLESNDSIATIHHLESVVEVYFNKSVKKVTELIHLSNNRVKAYQYDADEYIHVKKGTRIGRKIKQALKSANGRK
tara:strand:+ start:198 stop:449 length:252 start_codon:yes stop_codon:yes gene_type:complete